MIDGVLPIRLNAFGIEKCRAATIFILRIGVQADLSSQLLRNPAA
jgi:hypothetical protein